MDLGLSGKRAAVAAASAGLGYRVGRGAGRRRGGRVAICGRDRAKVDHAVSQLGRRRLGRVALDVGSIAGRGAGLRRGGDRGAGQARHPRGQRRRARPLARSSSTPEDAYGPALELNLLSTVGMCRAGVPAMQAQGWGRVVAITSIAVRQPIAELILSNTARAGVTGFLKTLALEVAGDGVTVNSVQPGLHATDRLTALARRRRQRRGAAGVPAGVVGRPEDFGAFVAFLCSDHARFLTGTAIPVDGGAYRALL